MEAFICRLTEQGLKPGSCLVKVNGKRMPACKATLKYRYNRVSRLITSVHLSRPENYLSIYQSGCNFSCRKCHSWHFSKIKGGTWYSPEDILKQAIAYERKVSHREPREKATAWHAHDSCRCCGSCVIYGKRSPLCPGVLDPKSILFSPQGFGPARNIVAFTGGDIACCPDFYGECARLLKASTNLWILLETNGYGLTPDNLDYLREAGIDAFWLDIKAFSPGIHKYLTGCNNDHILRLPDMILTKGFVLEVLSLYIPGLVETPELEKIAERLKEVNPAIPFTILAFFPEYQMKEFRSPTTKEMVDAYREVKSIGLENVRLGNTGVFARTGGDQRYLLENVDRNAF